MKPHGSRRGAGILALLFVLQGVLLAEDPVVRLRIPGVSGEPGEEVALEFRATVSQPLVVVVVDFGVDGQVADFIRTELEGTAAAHAPPQGAIFNEHGSIPDGTPAWTSGFNLQGGGRPLAPVAPGENLLLFKAVLRLRADAVAGAHAVQVLRAQGTRHVEGVLANDAEVFVESAGALTVEPPAGPRPVKDLTCSEEGGRVEFSWKTVDPCERILIERNGKLISSIPAFETRFEDHPDPGPTAYAVRTARGVSSSLPAQCDVIVDIPRPPRVKDLACAHSPEGVIITWINAAEYDAISIFRNGRLLASAEGTAGTHVDPLSPRLFTVYTVQGEQDGVRALPVSCKLNELSDSFAMGAGDARAQSGSSVPVEIFGTNPSPVQGFQLTARVDPGLAGIEEILPGAALDALRPDFFAASERFPGEVAVGVMFSWTSTRKLAPGADQHLLTALVVISGDARDVAIAVELTPSDRPLPTGLRAEPLFGVEGQRRDAETRPGMILVGRSPVPEVQGARAEESPEGDGQGPAAGQGGGAEAGQAVVLSWRNPVEFDAIRIERDGKPLAEIQGSEAVFLDADPGPGRHRYRITALQDGLSSFPVAVTLLPHGVPGTFVRGDANLDGRVNITDAIAVVSYFFLDGPMLACLDAADADDDGSLKSVDVASLLHWLFVGSRPLPPPGPDAAWFDPTEDGLQICE